MSRAALLYTLLDRSGALTAWRSLHSADLVLCYHGVIPAGATPAGDASLHLPRDRFEAQLDWLRARYRVVPLDELLMPPSAGAAPRAAITFDDAYRGVLMHGLPALRARRLPSTIFVASDFSETPRHFWWDSVAELAPGADRAALRDRFFGDRDSILGALDLKDAELSLGEEYLPADYAMLRAALDGDLTIGSHSVSHLQLARIGSDRLARELTASRRTIAERLGVPVRTIAYPYGNTAPHVADASRIAGYAAGLTIAGRLVRDRKSPHDLSRVNVPSSMPLSAFAAAASGFRVGGGG